MSDAKDKTQKAKKAAGDAEEAAETVVDQTVAAGSEAVSKLSEQASAAAQTVRDAASRAGAAVSDGYQRVSEQARESFDQSRDAARRWEEGLESSLKARPLATIMVAAGVGCLLGVLLASRHHRR